MSTVSPFPETFKNFISFQSETLCDRPWNSGIKALNPCSVFRNQYPLSMKGRNADNVCFRTIEPHRRCDSEAEPVINVCFSWLLAFNAHRHGEGEQDVNTIQI